MDSYLNLDYLSQILLNTDEGVDQFNDDLVQRLFVSCRCLNSNSSIIESSLRERGIVALLASLAVSRPVLRKQVFPKAVEMLRRLLSQMDVQGAEGDIDGSGHGNGNGKAVGEEIFMEERKWKQFDYGAAFFFRSSFGKTLIACLLHCDISEGTSIVGNMLISLLENLVAVHTFFAETLKSGRSLSPQKKGILHTIEGLFDLIATNSYYDWSSFLDTLLESFQIGSLCSPWNNPSDVSLSRATFSACVSVLKNVLDRNDISKRQCVSVSSSLVDMACNALRCPECVDLRLKEVAINILIQCARINTSHQDVALRQSVFFLGNLLSSDDSPVSNHIVDASTNVARRLATLIRINHIQMKLSSLTQISELLSQMCIHLYLHKSQVTALGSDKICCHTHFLRACGDFMDQELTQNCDFGDSVYKRFIDSCADICAEYVTKDKGSSNQQNSCICISLICLLGDIADITTTCKVLNYAFSKILTLWQEFLKSVDLTCVFTQLIRLAVKIEEFTRSQSKANTSRIYGTNFNSPMDVKSVSLKSGQNVPLYDEYDRVNYVLELFFSTYERFISLSFQGKLHIPGSALPIDSLKGLSSSLSNIIYELRKCKNDNNLCELRKQLLRFFCKLSLSSFPHNISVPCCPNEPIITSETIGTLLGMGFLLPSMAHLQEILFHTFAYETDECDTHLSRSLWFSLFLFRLSFFKIPERSWTLKCCSDIDEAIVESSLNPNVEVVDCAGPEHLHQWINALQTIATYTPSCIFEPKWLNKIDLTSPELNIILLSIKKSRATYDKLHASTIFDSHRLLLSEVYVCGTIQFLESLKLRKSMRMDSFLAYSCNEGGFQSQGLHVALQSLADKLFVIWRKRIRSLFSNDSCMPRIAFHGVEILTDNVVLLVGLCIHRNKSTRKRALSYVYSLLNEFECLKWSLKCIFKCLDTLQLIYTRSKISVSVSNETTSDETCILPNCSATLKATALSLFELVYFWLTSGFRIAVFEVKSILKEYLLLDGVRVQPFHLGGSIASEMVVSSTPTYFTSSTDSRNLAFHDERTIASSKIAKGFSRSPCSSCIYESEVMLPATGFENVFLVGLRRDEDESADMNNSSRNQRSYSEIYGKVLKELALPALNPGIDVISTIWKSVTLIQFLVDDVETKMKNINDRYYMKFSSALNILHLCSSIAVRFYRPKYVSCLCASWQWLLVKCHLLRPYILAEAMNLLWWSQRNSRSFLLAEHNFFYSTTKCIGNAVQEATFDEYPSSILCTLVENFMERYILHVEPPLLFCLESLLSASIPVLPVEKGMMAPNFQFLFLSLHTLSGRDSTAIPACNSLHNTSIRRILRELITRNVLHWFDGAMNWNDSYGTKDLNALLRFLDALNKDSRGWTEEYAVELQYLQLPWTFLAQSLKIDPVLVPINKAHLVVSNLTYLGIQIKIDGNAMSLQSGILCLIRMLILQELDRIVTWNSDISKDSGKSNFTLINMKPIHRLPDELKRISTPDNLKLSMKSAWIVKPSLAVKVIDAFPFLGKGDGKSVAATLETLVISNPSAVRGISTAIPILLGGVGRQHNCEDLCANELHFWIPSPMHLIIGCLSRCDAFSKQNTSTSTQLHVILGFARYAFRSFSIASTASVIYFIPQLICLLRRDEFGIVGAFLSEQARKSPLICHQLCNLLRSFVNDREVNRSFNYPVTDPRIPVILNSEGKSAEEEKVVSKYGHCHQLQGTDPLKESSAALIWRTRYKLSCDALLYTDLQLYFFEKLTSISAALKSIKDKDKHQRIIKSFLDNLLLHEYLYLPTLPTRKVVGIDVNSGTPMQSAAKCPFLLIFHTSEWNGPDSYLRLIDSEAYADLNLTHLVADYIEYFVSERLEKFRSKNALTPPNCFTEGKSRKSIPGTNNSVCGNISLHQDVGTDACIFKAFDDCRQDALTLQIIRLLSMKFSDAGVPVSLAIYSVIPSRSGTENAIGGIVQVIGNVKSRDHIGKDGAKTLLQYFLSKFGPRGSSDFKKAQIAFASSLAGYCVICYLLSIKDRHNGNLLFDDFGHIIHIDYGFILGISPGGNLGFESAPFKLTAEMIDLLDGKSSPLFALFTELSNKSFLIARQASSDILSIVSALADSGLPCFLHRNDNLVKLRARFMLELSYSEAATFWEKMIRIATKTWTTSAYDGIQLMQNNIYSATWR